MKRSLFFSILALVVLIASAGLGFGADKEAAGSPPVMTDTDWSDLLQAVKDKDLTMQQAIEEAKRIKEAVADAQDLNRQGKYLEAADRHPISYCKAWYTLSALREAMGGAKDENGIWSGYNVDKKGKYAGTEKERCVELANDVLGYVADARKSGKTGPPDGDGGYRDDTERIEAAVKDYLSGILG